MPRLSQAATNAASAESQQEVVMAAEGIENYELPKALVTRIAKSAIPENAKLQKEALHAMLKGSTVFINYLAATAHDLSRARGHKSVGAADVIKAIETIEFNTDGLLKFLEDDLEAFRAGTKKTKAAKAAAPGGQGKGKQKETNTATTGGRKLKIVIAPIRDDEDGEGGEVVEQEQEVEEEDVGEDVDELEDDVDEEPDETMDYDTTKDTSGAVSGVDESFRSAA
ncbi:Histone-like transcription factor (CBF/NF-Y) and archaeal histone [Ceratobasidium sp. AG-Ba]|nr:Histone-like transcription factor (CBF/NF-Y) and archaeal histone [Ceratobasidium sp. AG-Ba]QRW10276.1 Histone-like transcription factor (CBF/NF-Y) and archaeal histone [Ceratobasidium sp. AG-Ba]